MYRVEIYCTDCTGIDYMGCFDGGTRFLLEKKSPDAALKFVEFDTIEAAEKRGWDEVMDCSPWQFYIRDEDDQIVFNSYS